MLALAAAQIVFMIEQKFAARDFAVSLLQPRFHNRGEEAADNVLTRGCASRTLGALRGGAGNAISDGDHGNLLFSNNVRKLLLNLLPYCNATYLFFPGSPSSEMHDYPEITA